VHKGSLKGIITKNEFLKKKKQDEKDAEKALKRLERKRIKDELKSEQ
jgi:hypothetical protein